MARKGLKSKADFERWSHRITSRKAFYARWRDYATAVIPKFVKPPTRGNLFWTKNKNLSLREAARRRVCVRFSYKRVKDNRVFSYLVEPYSFRFKRGRLGFRKFFYGYHRTMRARGTRGIHMFYWFRIFNIAVSKVTFRKRWPVEVAYRPIPGMR